MKSTILDLADLEKNSSLGSGMSYLVENTPVSNLFLFGEQVGQMGCVPARGRYSNGRNVLCSQPSLHRQGAPWGRGAI